MNINKVFVVFLAFVSVGCQMLCAQTDLGNYCEAFMPAIFYQSKVIKQSDIDALLSSTSYGQDRKPTNGKRYWIAYSDRDENVTYKTPSKSSGEFSRLKFNEEVRIAKIQSGFALVYNESNHSSLYPNIARANQPLTPCAN